MSNYYAGGGGGSTYARRSDGRGSSFPSMPSGTASTSKVPGQEGQPKGLNEDYYRESAAALGVPVHGDGGTQAVPPTSAVVARPRSRSRSSSRSASRSSRGRAYSASSRSRTYDDDGLTEPLHHARNVMDRHFSHTKTGIGVGIVGAVVGGIVAKKASEVAFRPKYKKSGRPRHSAGSAPRAVTAILGAVAGGLGANAIVHKVEDARDHAKHDLQVWEGRYDRDQSSSHYDRGRSLDWDRPRRKGYTYEVERYERVHSNSRPSQYRSDYDYYRHRY